MTTQKNGATIPTNGKKVETTVVLTPVKSEEKPVAKVIDLSPLEKRLLHIQELMDIKSKHNRLLLSGQKLDEFQFKKGEENIRLTIEDESSRGVEFTTTNPEVIKEAIAVVRGTIQERRKEIEARLLAA